MKKCCKKENKWVLPVITGVAAIALIGATVVGCLTAAGKIDEKKVKDITNKYKGDAVKAAKLAISKIKDFVK